MGQAFEELDPFFFEEPVDAMNVDSMKKVAEKVNIPLAGGERLYTRYGFRQYIEAQVFAVIQPDVGLTGGISESKKIATYAETYNLHVQPHNCAGPVASAAAYNWMPPYPIFSFRSGSPTKPRLSMIWYWKRLNLKRKMDIFPCPPPLVWGLS